jgi:hypothetical protein
LFLSASGTPAAVTTAAQLAHFFFESLHTFGQPVEALVDLLPVSLFVLGAASPLSSRVRAFLAPGPGSGSTSPGATLRASVAPVSSAAQRCTSRSVFVQLTRRFIYPVGLRA